MKNKDRLFAVLISILGIIVIAIYLSLSVETLFMMRQNYIAVKENKEQNPGKSADGDDQNVTTVQSGNEKVVSSSQSGNVQTTTKVSGNDEIEHDGDSSKQDALDNPSSKGGNKSGDQNKQDSEARETERAGQGSAVFPEGNVVIVSIVADDYNNKWGDSKGDTELLERGQYYLEYACDWLSSQAKRWGHELNFIYEFDEAKGLCYRGYLETDMTNYMDYDVDSEVFDFIDENVNAEEIKSKYETENIIYILFLNTDSTNMTTSYTRNYYDGMSRDYEYCAMLMNCEGYEETPSAFAHEMLHTFGAPDLYYAGMSNITQEYIDQIKDSGLNDIMRITSDPNTYQYVYDDITNEITDITAYYVGLTDHSDTVTEWGFAPSEHDK
jgi:hypothetical protein